jgi:hypothetical protein
VGEEPPYPGAALFGASDLAQLIAAVVELLELLPSLLEHRGGIAQPMAECPVVQRGAGRAAVIHQGVVEIEKDSLELATHRHRRKGQTHVATVMKG